MRQDERISLPIWKKIIVWFISIIAFAFQIIVFFICADIYFDYTISITKNIGFLFLLLYVIAVGYVFYIINKKIPSNIKITWSILILLAPLPFCILYSLNSFSKKVSIKKRKRLFENIKINPLLDDKYKLWIDNPQGANLVHAVQRGVYAPVYKNIKYTFFSNIAHKHLDLLEELKTAKKYILIEYFIIADGKLMNDILPILEEKGTSGVKIYILYDDIGSKGVMNYKLLNRISQIPNCKIDNFQPLGVTFSLLVNYRDHRKIFIIDGRVAYCGGDNLADEYIHKKNRFGYWRDNCGKFEGRVVDTFVHLFCETWYTSTKEILEFEQYNFDDKSTINNYVMAFGDGPVNNADSAYDLFTSMIMQAQKSIYISTPYFIIDDSMISIIATKAKCGIDVRLLMPKIPDKKAAFYLGRENYRILLKAGVKIYEFVPGFNHAKNVIVDDQYAFIGTINFDYRSMFLHYECGALIISDIEIVKMKEDFLDAIFVSEEVKYDVWKKRPIYQRIIAFILNIFSTMF